MAVSVDTRPHRSQGSDDDVVPAGRRVAALDGLRGLAVLAVLAFHFGVGWFQGGFLGVDVFYVLSGFLITTLLVEEYRRRGQIGLRAFWARRARRLLPCLLLVLVAVALYVRYVAPPGAYPQFRMQALSALFYFSNWYQIAASGNYFVHTGPVSLLTHTWSLAIEEQFYLLWPVLVVAVLRLSGTFRRGLRALTALSVAGAAASAVEMAWLDSPRANLTRLYFGTDTHAQSILIGASLACLFASVASMRSRTRDGLGPSGAGTADRLALPRATSVASRLTLQLLGVVGLGAVVALCHLCNGNSAATYRGDFALAALASAAVVAAATLVPGGGFERMLAVRPVRWLGTISYGVYLWHFPLAFLLSPLRTGTSGFTLLALRSAATIAVATASYVLVERPVLRGTFWRSARALLPAGAGVGATVGILLVSTAGAAASAPLARHFRPSATTAAAGASAEARVSDAEHRPVTAASSGSLPASSTTTTAPTSGASAVADPPPRVVVLGDSTALTLGYALEATAPPGTTVVNDGLFGCGLAIAANSSGAAPSPGLDMATPCNSATPSDQQWPAVDTADVADTGPGDVVIFVAGHWETQDLLMSGTWTNILSPSFDAYELGQLRTLVDVATAHGAHLELFTMACMDANFASGSPPGPTDSAQRRDLYNGMLDQVASGDAGNVSVVPYGSILCPTGSFTEDLDGVQVRTPDGVHTPAYVPGNIFAGNSSEPVAEAFYNWLSPRLWPLIIDPPTTP